MVVLTWKVAPFCVNPDLSRRVAVFGAPCAPARRTGDAVGCDALDVRGRWAFGGVGRTRWAEGQMVAYLVLLFLLVFLSTFLWRASHYTDSLKYMALE